MQQCWQRAATPVVTLLAIKGLHTQTHRGFDACAAAQLDEQRGLLGRCHWAPCSVHGCGPRGLGAHGERLTASSGVQHGGDVVARG